LLQKSSIDPELMIRMLAVEYVVAIRSERLICREDRRVGKANGSRECAPDAHAHRLSRRRSIRKMVGTAPRAPLPTLRA
jgi:hypothetical protein